MRGGKGLKSAPQARGAGLAEAMRMATRAVHMHMQGPIRKTGLTNAEYWVLHWVDHFGPMHSGNLAERLNVRLPTLTSVVDKLVGQGLLERTRDPTDRRVVVLGCTPKGRRLLAGVARVASRLVAEASRGVPEVDRRTAATVLLAIAMNLQGKAHQPLPKLKNRS